MLKRDPKKLFLRYTKKGDAAALGKVFDILAPELLGLALHLTRRIELAEDVLQDTFLAAAESADRFDPRRDFHPWIVGILVNRARKVRESVATSRLQAIGHEQLAESAHDGRGASPKNPGKEAEAEEVRTRVAAAIGSLSAPYREVVDAHLTDGLPPRDIAPALGRTPGTVRVQLHRGLEQLRETLGSRMGIAGLEMLSLAPTSALMMSGEAGRGLAAVKFKVLASLPASATEAAAATGGGATASTWAIAAGTALIGAGAWVFMQLGGASPGGAPNEADVALQAPLSAPTSPQLAEVSDLEPSPKPGRSRDAVRPPRVQPGSATAPAKAAARPDPAGPEKVAPPPKKQERFRFRIEPSIDRTGLDEFGPFRTCRFHARSNDRLQLLGAGQAVFNDFRVISIGAFESSDDLPSPLIVHFDHPDALPCEVSLSRNDWFSDTVGYVARPIMRLQKVEYRVSVKTEPLRETFTTPGASFQGEVLLMKFDAQSVPLIFDRQPLGEGRSRSASLRVPANVGGAMVLGIPESPGLFSASTELTPAAIEPTGAEGKKSHPSLTLRPRILPPMRFDFEDPFGAPMKNLEVRAVVPIEVILVRDPFSGDPVVFEGRVFCACHERDVVRYGQATGTRRTVSAHVVGSDPIQWADAKVLAITHQIESVTGANGTVSLPGSIRGLHRFEARSPVTGEWEPLEGERSWKLAASPAAAPSAVRTYSLRGPAAGLEIECPADLVDEPELWKTATITVTSGAFKASPQPRGGRVRLLVPQDSMLNVQVRVGDREYTALSMGISSGQSQLITSLSPRTGDRPGRTKPRPKAPR